ncbi:DUF2786 domain-containing protein [[Haemophilus] ducreyi]|uniref:Uncharacterized protein n=1 Tax=Haemophilus ducreyi (strain 35000HP / ATCC 700724) TaxID=233412 RepID=Q7VPH3_HAEDU|nr:DUF2786 domain-containing protein [[Haemophilus] ducreyi]AAP95108.1 hypothetical protein HD_0105 [[Haemophilus] ducreyi 35000HP]AKO39062.1 hypothetical protein RZ63_00400 [[Haemophilus] ducreyi]ASE06730.1 DUF2786 domain-containing protein [[Haemophilus] ducreyi]
MQNEKTLRKIKKLLALSKSSNPHEAAKALEMAQKLMQENRINQVEIEFSQYHGKQKTAKKSARYVHQLVGVITRAFGVDAYMSNFYPDKDEAEEKMHVVFYGAEGRPEIASYCFDVLYRQLQTARKEFLATQSKRLKRSTLISRGDEFCQGWVFGVHENVKEFAMTPEEKGKLERYRYNGFKDLQTAKVRDAGETRDYGLALSQGYKQGSKVTLNHGVNGKETTKLGGDEMKENNGWIACNLGSA